MKTTVYIPARALKAAVVFAAEKDPRYYLEGVVVQRRRGLVKLVATDGHVLLVQVLDDVDNAGELDFDAILPREVGDKLRRPKLNESQLVKLELTLDDEPKAYRATCNAQKLEGLLVEGVFPVWERLVPMATSGEAAFYNPELICRIFQAAKQFGRQKGSHKSLVDLYQNGEGPAVARFTNNPSALALVMPYREPDSEPWPPASYFVRTPETQGAENETAL